MKPRRTVSWWLAAGLLGGAAGGAFIGQHWRQTQAIADLRQALPPLPDLSGRPAALVVRLEAAQRQALDPATAEAGVEALGRLLHANGFAAEAAVCWRWLSDHEPTNARWPYLESDAHAALGDPAAMETLLQRTVDLDPSYAPAWLRLAERQFKTGRPAEAADAYNRRLTLLPDDPYAQLGLARIHLQSGPAATVRSQLESIVRAHPDFGSAHNLLARLLAEAGEEAAARQHRWLGQNSGRFAEAPDLWREELARDCLTPDLLIMLGTVDFQLNRGDRGRARFEQAVALAPEIAANHALLGDLYLKLGDAAAARTSLLRALELAPADERVMATYLNLAEAERQLERPDRALQVLAQAEQTVGDSVELWNARGVTYTQLGRRAEARAAYEAALARQADNTDANFNLGIHLLSEGQEAAAEAHFRRALTLRPTFLPALTMLVRLPMSQGRLDEAKPALDTLFEAYAGVPQVRELAGRWYDAAITAARSQGQIERAQRLTAEARDRLNPTSPQR